MASNPRFGYHRYVDDSRNPERSKIQIKSHRDFKFPFRHNTNQSSSSLGGIFRQVGRQFSSRKSGTVLGTTFGNGSQAPFLVLSPTQNNRNHGHSSELLGPPSCPTAAYQMSLTEVRSFFSEDSSQIRGHNSLRKRTSNLRARIPNPYTSRAPAHLNESEALRVHIVPYTSATGRSRANINSEQEDEYGMPIANFRHHKLRSKVSGWFRDAGLAMRRRVKLRNGADVPCIPYR